MGRNEGGVCSSRLRWRGLGFSAAWLGLCSRVTQPRSQSATHARTYARTTAVCQCVPVGGGRIHAAATHQRNQRCKGQSVVSSSSSRRRSKKQHTHTQRSRGEPNRNATHKQRTNAQQRTANKATAKPASQPAIMIASQQPAVRSLQFFVRPSLLVVVAGRRYPSTNLTQ